MTPEERERAIVTIGKERLASLPAASYAGKIKVVDELSQVSEAVSALKKSPVIGFDTETRPSFKKGQCYNVALVQLATPSCCYLFRTNIIGYPEELISLLEDPHKLKVGLSLHDDFHNLRKVADMEPAGFIDLQQFVKQYRIADNSLSRIHAILFGERISKGQRLTNWEADKLTEAQQAYASLDASACIRIYRHLKDDGFDPLASQYLTVPEIPSPAEEDAQE